MTIQTFQTLVVTIPISDTSLAKLQSKFDTVYYFPAGADSVTKEALKEAEVWLSTWLGPADWVELNDVPNLRIMQLTSAGGNKAFMKPLLNNPEARKQITLTSASGIHVFSIPQYIIGQIVNIYNQIYTEFIIGRTEKRWSVRSELALGKGPSKFALGFQTMRGKTAGLLGYGHIGRETARLLQAFGVTVIAANSSGERRQDNGYIVPGTGDKEGIIPERYYSTNDPSSFESFLRRCDLLIASLPSTKATQWLLTAKHLKLVPKGCVFINVGRGDLVHTSDLLDSLDSDKGIYAAVLDVTDPEPLPQGHPLFSHPRVIITPHTSGEFNMSAGSTSGYFDAVVDLLCANVDHIRSGGEPFNVLDPIKGY